MLRANEEQQKASEALDAADRLARTSGDRLARAQTSKSQALELARSERERRRVASQMRRESALARLRVVEEARKAESEARALDQRLSAARIDAERASAAVGIAARNQERATLIEQLTDAEAAHAATTRAASDYADQKEREASATAALASAEATLATATADRDAAYAALGDERRRAGACARCAQ